MKQEYAFSDKSLYQQALTHKSAGARNNERLEFLGDAIVNYLIAEAIYIKFPHASEGEMSRQRSQLVKQESLADIARELNLGDQLILGSGEMKSGGHRRDSILANALEALIAAIYLDSSMSICKQIILPWFAMKLDKLSLDEEYRDHKTLLQEWLQSRKLPLPVYDILEETGADNERLFKVRCVTKASGESVVAEGNSKKQAEQKAAALMHNKLQLLTESKKQKARQ